MRLKEILAPKDIFGGLKNPELGLLDKFYTTMVYSSNDFYVPVQLLSPNIRDELVEQFNKVISLLNYDLLDQDWKIKYDQLTRYFSS
jgi:hypothetical protein